MNRYHSSCACQRTIFATAPVLALIIIALPAWSEGLDTNFTATAAGNFVQSMAVSQDGKILVGGSFTRACGAARNNVAVFKPGGGVDDTFNPGVGANSEVLSVAWQPDGKAVIGGSFTAVNRVNRRRIARLHNDGSLDLDFNPGTGADNAVRAVLVQKSGRILIGGQFTRYDGAACGCVARLNPDGTLDRDFTPGYGIQGFLFVNALAVQSDGKILVGGDFSGYHDQPYASIVRLNEDGSIDPSFQSGKGTTLDNPIISIALQPDGHIMIAGSFYAYQGVRRVNIARLNPDGSLDGSFDPGRGLSGGLYNMIQCVVVRSDGKILAGGSFDRVDGIARGNLVLLQPDGRMDTSFMVTVDSPVRSIVLPETGGILIGGEFSRVDGVPRNRMARLWGETAACFREMRTGQDGFCSRLEGAPPGAVVEASVDLRKWTPVYTNAAVDSDAVFRDSAAVDLAWRFYRVRSGH